MQYNDVRGAFIAKLTILFIAIIFIFVIVEFAVRYFAPQNLVPRYVEPNAELGNITKANVDYIQLRYDMETRYRVKTNSVGMRMNEEIDASPERRKIIFLGDSVLFGWEINIEDTFFALLRDIIEPKTNVQLLNAGQPGYSTGHVFKNFRRYSDEAHISAAVYFVNPNDVTDNVDKNINNSVFSYKRNDNGEIELKEELVFSPRKRFLLTKTPYGWINQNIHSLFLIKRSIRSLFPKHAPALDADSGKEWSKEEIREVYDVSLAHLKNLANFAREKDIPLLIIWIPAPAELFPQWNKTECTHGMDYDVLKRMISEHESILSDPVKFFDAKESFFVALGDLQDDEIYHGGGGCNFHFNKKGNEIFSAAVADEIQQFLSTR